MAIRALRVAACLLIAGCGSSDAPFAPSPLTPPIPVPAPSSGGTTATITDALSAAAIPNLAVHVDGVGDAMSDSNGRVVVDSTVAAVRSVTLTSPVTLQRISQLLIPGPAVTLSVIPSSFDVQSFDQMFRSAGRLQRWMSAPRLVLQRRVVEYTSAGSEFTATADVLTDAEASEILTHLRWALPQLTGNRFTTFAEEIQETAAPGERVLMVRVGAIIVAESVGLTAATTFWGIGRWASDMRGVIVGGTMLLDRGFETSGSQFRRSLRAHELGHGLGYGHVTLRSSFMNSSARVEPNSFDTEASKIAFQREPGSRSPDTDPFGFTANAAVQGPIRWAPWVP